MDPSKGGIGSKLKAQRAMLISTMYNNVCCKLPLVDGARVPITNASKKLLKGPASATRAESRLGFLK